MIKDLLCGDITQEDYLHINNANITYLELPEGINGFVYYYKNIYNIFVNNTLPYYWKKKTLLHEFAHIELNQLCQSNKDMLAFCVKDYEDEACEYIRSIKVKISALYGIKI